MNSGDLTAASQAEPAAVDHETRACETEHAALRLWLRILACTNLLEADLRTRLRQSFDSTLPRFDMLAQLDRHPKGLKMRELSKRLMVTGGNVTGLTDKLVEEGLVQRHEDPNDRRVYTIQLTSAGKRQFRKMAQMHEQWVIELFNGLNPKDQAGLFELLGKLKTHLVASR